MEEEIGKARGTGHTQQQLQGINALNTNPQIKPVKVHRLQKREDTRQPPLVSQKHRDHEKQGLPSPHYQPNAVPTANNPRLAQPQQPLQVHRNTDKNLKEGCGARGPSIKSNAIKGLIDKVQLRVLSGARSAHLCQALAVLRGHKSGSNLTPK